jgi:hypothetical protein
MTNRYLLKIAQMMRRTQPKAPWGYLEDIDPSEEPVIDNLLVQHWRDNLINHENEKTPYGNVMHA